MQSMNIQPHDIPLPVYFLAGDTKRDPVSGTTSIGKIPQMILEWAAPSGAIEERVCVAIFSNEIAARLFAEGSAACGSTKPVRIGKPSNFLTLLKQFQLEGATLLALDPLAVAVGSIQCMEIEGLILHLLSK